MCTSVSVSEAQPDRVGGLGMTCARQRGIAYLGSRRTQGSEVGNGAGKRGGEGLVRNFISMLAVEWGGVGTHNNI